MKNKWKFLIAFAVLTISMSSNSFASTYNANITLPTFEVRVNGVEIDNKNREYPLIVYKDITYFPMTYYDSRFLGLETKWNKASGLKINKSEILQGYVDYNSSANKSRYSATIINGNVEVNGKFIDNSKEQYPLLMFRDVTYFPLTWKFAVDEFGWKYKFTKEKGLEISNHTNLGLEVKQLKLPVADRGDYHNAAFTVAGDYIYYEGEGGIIYQSPVSNPNLKKAVYELPLWSYGDSYVYPSLTTADNKAMLFYHQGGASMGTDYEIILNHDGTNETFAVGYLNMKVFGDYVVNVGQYVPPSQNNLSVKKFGEDFKSVGDENYIYGWTYQNSPDGSSGFGSSNDLYFINDEIFVLAYYKPREEYGTTGIHKVNINTNETVRICDESAKKFIIEDNMIYFMDLDGYLYKVPLNGSTVEKLTNFTVSDFTVLNNMVYYVAGDEKGLELFKLGESESINPGGRVKELVKTDGYVYCIFENSSPYKLIVFNKEGIQVFKTNSNIKFACINNNRLFYQK